MQHHPAWVQLLLDRRFLYSLVWVVALSIGVGRFINARYCFNNVTRPDGNHGHTTIDFGGQWLMGRMLALGHGRDLFSRPVQRQVLQQAFSRSSEAPNATEHDSESLMSAFMGTDDERWEQFGGALAATYLPSGPWLQTGAALSASPEWSPDAQRDLFHPQRAEGLGGPLYPPINAFVLLPFALGDHPQAAYMAMQVFQTSLCFLAGLGVAVLSRGRFWWPLASAIVLIYPGCRGAVDLGQNSPLTLTILVWGWVFMARGRPTLGGVFWGLLAYKPVWAVSFFLLLVLMRQWRAVFAMGLTGLALIAATLPFVGVQTWKHWLFIGQMAADMYNVDGNWIPLSRDVLGLPRRLLLDFSAPRDQRSGNLLALAVCWALWAVVMEVAVRVYVLSGRPDVPFTGPLPAMLILTAWMCTYHFIYYDTLISALGVFVLLADPRPYLRRRTLEWSGRPDHRSSLLVNSFVLTWLAMLLGYETILRPMRLEATAYAAEFTSKRTLSDGGTEPAPRIQVGTDDRCPVDTLMILVLWAACGAYSLQGWQTEGDSPPAS